MYRCKYFKIQELVDPELYEIFKNHEELLWKLFDPSLLMGIDWLRDKYGPASINTWNAGGNRMWSGLRTPRSKWYSLGSMHSVGKAADMIFKIPAEKIRQDMKTMMNVPYITRIEEGVTWLHVDTKFTDTGDTKDYYFLP